ncbi:hypothetical protein CY35_12G006900 [Sphagnum magellanicum]|nr:hypothetical protein CY35_12G006900 [Sphagnum magellanicum]
MQVFKGEKMAGHMGALRRTVNNVWIHKTEPERDLVWVRGQVCTVPGHKGNFVYIKDAFYKKPNLSMLPFPTYFALLDDSMSPLLVELSETDLVLQKVLMSIFFRQESPNI